MLEIILAVGVAAFVVYAAFSISALISLRRTSDSVRTFLRSTEGDLNETLAELRATLENLRRISGDVKDVTGDVREISGTVAELERGIREIVAYLRETLGSAAEAQMAGLKAGITTGVVTLMKDLQKGRRDDHEGGTGKEQQ